MTLPFAHCHMSGDIKRDREREREREKRERVTDFADTPVLPPWTKKAMRRFLAWTGVA